MASIDTILRDSLNTEVMDDLGKFIHKVIQQGHYNNGLIEDYTWDEPALAPNVAYFNPQLTLEAGAQRIANYIVCSDISLEEKICNTIVKHFYGPTEIHQILTGENDPAKALVDFARLNEDEEYARRINYNLELAASMGIPVYDTTAVRTSLWGAANTYVTEKRRLDERNKDRVNMLLWIGSFLHNGLIDQIKEATSLKESFKAFTSLGGIGNYYGYHSSITNSINPDVRFSHDDRFSVAGPGARATLTQLFGKVKVKHDDQVVWFRENYEEFIGKVTVDPRAHNLNARDGFCFAESQDGLKTSGTEVALCQYGVYTRLREKTHLIGRRQIPQFDDFDTETFFEKCDSWRSGTRVFTSVA